MTLQDIENKLRALEANILAVWQKDKVLLCVLVIPLILLKVRSMIIDQLTQASKKDLATTVVKSDQLQAQENKENVQADAIIKQADQTRKTEQDQPVTDDWYKNNGNNDNENK